MLWLCDRKLADHESADGVAMPRRPQTLQRRAELASTPANASARSARAPSASEREEREKHLPVAERARRQRHRARVDDVDDAAGGGHPRLLELRAVVDAAYRSVARRSG